MYDWCYKKNAQAMTWIDATMSAVAQNATLASIHSGPHNRWVAEHLRRVGWLGADLWLGLHDIAKEGSWEHVDGSALDFTFWAQNEPGNSNGKQHCAFLSTNTGWYDDYCYNSRPSLMRWNMSAAQLPEGM
jgi:hypothetical protein